MAKPNKHYDVEIELTVRVTYGCRATNVANAELDGNTTTLREVLGMMVQAEPGKYSIHTVAVREAK